HNRKCCERPDGWLRRSNLGVRRAGQPPLVAGRNDTDVRPPSISAPATLLARPFAPRFSLRHPIVHVSSRTNIRRLACLLEEVTSVHQEGRSSRRVLRRA